MESMGMPMNVFLSASARDVGDRDDLLRHLARLPLDVWHAGRMLAGANQRDATGRALTRADVALVLASANYFDKGDAVDTELPRIIEEKARRGLVVVPVLLSPCMWKRIDTLKELLPLPKDGVPISRQPDREEALANIAEALDAMAKQSSPSHAPLGPPKVSLRRLPHGGEHFFGRETELARLDDAWTNTGRTRVLSIIAMGGAGKSSLVSRWLKALSPDYRGARRVFDYSFYRQGATDARVANADLFFAEALTFFGDPQAAKRPPFERADRLVELVRQERTLLVLDGLEPLQSPPDQPDAGRLRDRALAVFLEEMAAQNPGLVLVTSRERLSDLGPETEVTPAIKLDQLPDAVGVLLLREIGVTGEEGELREAVESFRGHALALTLLGNLLVEQHHGDVRKHREIPSVFDADIQGEPARRAMAAYDNWLGAKERAVLRLLGLFDRPASAGALKALRAEPAVPGLNKDLVGIEQSEWNRLIARLRRAGLVERTELDQVDAHPIVREYFRDRLREKKPAAWKEGNRRLYVWYSELPKWDRPDTAEEMVPLYAAVLHGCRAHLYLKVYDDVFRKRIRRFGRHYSTRKLGAFGADLSALANFFEEPWTRPVTALREEDRSSVLNDAGVALRALGRLPEAVAPMRIALQAAVESGDNNAPIGASNLSELYLVLGQLTAAIETGRQSIELADRSGDAFLRLFNRTTLADALHQAGQPDDAALLFIEAERMQKELQPMFPLLYNVQGYCYCDLLLWRGETEEVVQRAAQTLKYWDTFNDGGPLVFALDHLSLARAHLTLHPNASQTRTHFDKAVAHLREAGQQAFLVHGLIHRTAFHRRLHEFDAATGDLDEALRHATRGQMRLYEADARLERTRLLLARHKPAEARAELDLARKMIDQMGYGRRKPEVEELTRQLGALP